MFHLLLAVIYLSFISLGLPDSLLGSAWPVMYPSLSVPVSYAGVITMIIALGTVLSSLQSDRLTRSLGAGKVTALSVACTAVAMFGFSCSGSFWMLCLWAIPYGLGAGSVDAALNNYVALHYSSRHMSWLHCMWGVGASVGPYVMGLALTHGQGWQTGYRSISLIQVALTAVLVFSLPLWKQKEAAAQTTQAEKTAPVALSLRQVVALPGAKAVMASFFCYSLVEQTTMLWAGSYLVLWRGIPAETAASWVSLFCVGITIGRALSGFLTLRLNDSQMIRLGLALIAAGIACLFIPLQAAALAALMLIGLGCAPIYPSIIHATPARFGPERSQALIGVQMASAYVGTALMPPLFGLIANHISVALLPVYLLAGLAVIAVTQRRLDRCCKA